MHFKIKFNAILLTVLPLLLSIQTTNAQAFFDSKYQQNLSSTTGRWGTQLATATGSGSSTAYQITWTGNSNKQYELLSFINTGDFDLISEHLSFSTAKANGDTTNLPTLTFELCSGNWDTTTFLCNGTITLSGSSIGGNINFLRYLISGNRLVFRVTNARNNPGNYLTTLNSQTFRSDVRNGLRFNS